MSWSQQQNHKIIIVRNLTWDIQSFIRKEKKAANQFSKEKLVRTGGDCLWKSMSLSDKRINLQWLVMSCAGNLPDLIKTTLTFHRC